MDVHCSTCGEPWDIYHLRHNAISETDLPATEANAWTGLSQSKRMAPRYREKFRAVGYEFGRTVYNVIRCPVCPKNARPDTRKLQAKELIEEVLGEDEDGIAAAINEQRL